MTDICVDTTFEVQSARIIKLLTMLFNTFDKLA